MELNIMLEKLDKLENKLAKMHYDVIDFYDLDALRTAIYVLKMIRDGP